MKKGGYGTYCELSEINRKNKDTKPNDFHDVYGSEMTDWNDVYDGEKSPTIACLEKSINDDLIQDMQNEFPVEHFSNASEFWYEEPSELLNQNKIFQVLPQKEYSYEQNLNAIARLGIYLSLIFAYKYDDLRYLLLILVFLFITLFAYINNITSIKEFLQVCIPKPNKENFISYIKNKNYSTDIAYSNAKKLITHKDTINRYNPESRDNEKCANSSQNETTGGYDWLKQSSHADFRSNSRLMNTNSTMRQKLFGDVNDNYGKEIADRNSYIAVHPRDYINTNFAEFLYGKNLDRRLYYSKS